MRPTGRYSPETPGTSVVSLKRGKKRMNEDLAKKRIAVCDTQPITAQGLRNLLASSEDLELVEAMNSLEAATAFVRVSAPDIVVVDKGFGMRAVLDWIHDLKLIDATPAITVWGVSMTEAEALRLLQAGAKGIGRKAACAGSLLTCLRTVASGRS